MVLDAGKKKESQSIRRLCPGTPPNKRCLSNLKEPEKMPNNKCSNREPKIIFPVLNKMFKSKCKDLKKTLNLAFSNYSCVKQHAII
jgi:hypothetical protein